MSGVSSVSWHAVTLKYVSGFSGPQQPYKPQGIVVENGGAAQQMSFAEVRGTLLRHSIGLTPLYRHFITPPYYTIYATLLASVCALEQPAEISAQSHVSRESCLTYKLDKCPLSAAAVLPYKRGWWCDRQRRNLKHYPPGTAAKPTLGPGRRQQIKEGMPMRL